MNVRQLSTFHVGAGLLAKAVCQATSMSTDTPSSRASPLPQVTRPAAESITQPIFSSGVPESHWRCLRSA
ncbi:hypothetical protein EYC95_20770 [Pseudomonas sp. BGI-2]|nr:hypothetical protein EYC95_20770 [Pseudomonas sp. BGI-2]